MLEARSVRIEDYHRAHGCSLCLPSELSDFSIRQGRRREAMTGTSLQPLEPR
jgi:hypothetical protein